MTASLNDPPGSPPRLTDDRAEADPAERAAGAALRCAASMAYRPAPPLARVAARMRAAHPQRRLTWALVATAFILGLGTAASAAHLNLLPTWLEAIVRPKPAVDRGGERPGKPRPATVRPRIAPPATIPLETPPSAAPAPAPTPVPQLARTAAPAATPETTRPTPVADIARPVPGRRLARLEQAEPQPASRTRAATAFPAPRPATAIAGSAAVARPTGERTDMPAPTVAPAAAPAGHAPPRMPSRPDSALPSPTAPPSPPGAGKHLAEIVALLRAEHTPGRALRLLDQHQAELTRAGFAHETLILRVEALLALGRRGEVLRLLDGAALTDVAASRALLVTRGQLRAAARRCADAVGDFDLVLSRAKELDREALAARAACRRSLGDEAGARADLQRLQAP